MIQRVGTLQDVIINAEAYKVVLVEKTKDRSTYWQMNTQGKTITLYNVFRGGELDDKTASIYLQEAITQYSRG